jgi:hypothetical protein
MSMIRLYRARVEGDGQEIWSDVLCRVGVNEACSILSCEGEVTFVGPWSHVSCRRSLYSATNERE